MKGAEPDLSAATFQIHDESHTIGNALRWMLMKKFVLSYSIHTLWFIVWTGLLGVFFSALKSSSADIGENFLAHSSSFVIV
jgi:hypothetical protein